MQAQNCARTKSTNVINRANPGSGIKMQPKVAKRQEMYVMEVNFRFSSNMLANCRLGPHKKVMERRDRKFPTE